MYRNLLKLSILVLVFFSTNVVSATTLDSASDPHYSEIGFFDIHTCNWPKRPNFFKVLFSSEKFKQIKSMKVYAPNKKLIVKLDKKIYKLLIRKNKPIKHVFMLDIDIPSFATSGWYTIDVEDNRGKHYYAKDYVIFKQFNRATKLRLTKSNKKPVILKWKAVPGAQHYKVFIKDEWSGERVLKSGLLNNNQIKIPDALLEPGGNYSWFVHARDTNEHVLLGDFNMGSISKKSFFKIKDE